MRNLLLVSLLGLVFGCSDDKKIELSEGIWLMELQVSDNEVLPFNFDLSRSETGVHSMEINNAEEKMIFDEIETLGDSIVIRLPVYEGYVAGKLTENKITVILSRKT